MSVKTTTTMTTATTTTTPPSPSIPAPTPKSHIYFGATPHRSPIPRYASSYTRRSLHSTHSRQSTTTTPSPTQSQIDTDTMSRTPSPTPQQQPAPLQHFTDMLPSHQLKSMSDLDKEEEARLARMHRVSVMKMGVNMCRWVGRMGKSKGNSKSEAK